MTSTLTPELTQPTESAVSQAVAEAARAGLTSHPKTLPPWLFYDETGSRLFEQITTLPEYYLTRTERALFAANADEIFLELIAPLTVAPLTVVELGAGSASKTGILLHALTRFQQGVLYQPIDISPTALDEARETIERTIPEVTVRPQTANYITDPIHIQREPHSLVLALYIGSSIGNFSPSEARMILTRLRRQLQPGDALLLGTDLAPDLPAEGFSANGIAANSHNGNGHPANGHSHKSPTKSIDTLLAAYNDAAGVTAAFNRNILHRLNSELDANFNLDRFTHQARWNPTHSRIEMHLESACAQTVRIPANAAGPALTLHFTPGETIHTENSYKFTPAAISALLADCAFTPTRTFTDPHNLFAVTLATAI